MKLAFVLSVASVLSFVSGARGVGPAFYGDPPDARHPWAVHDPNRPQPAVVTPGTFSSQEKAGQPPSDAVVLFDGKDLSGWVSDKNGGPAKWLVKDGYMEVNPGSGDIHTKDEFADCQLHVEWSAPTEIKGSSQGRGNSGIFLMGICEVQVLDIYDNPTYADGGAGSIYGVNPPMVNVVRPPGQFQVYDIVFRAPVYLDGKAIDPGYVTVFINGVLVQDCTPLEGPTGHMKRTVPGPFPAKGPIKLQDHGNPMKFRNIWYRKLPPRPVQGGLDGGFLTEETVTAKRGQIAAEIRQDAERMSGDPVARMLRLLESLEYQQDPATWQKVSSMAADYLERLKQTSADKLASRKDQAKQVSAAFDFMKRFRLVPPDFAPAAGLAQFIKDQKWDKK